MLIEKLATALSNQVNAEYYSAFLYPAMSAAASDLGFKGAANWLFIQAQEEMAHGTRIFQYTLDRGSTPSFAAIEKPPTAYTSLDEMFKAVLDHEKKVTKSINAIATLAMQESDHACYQFMGCEGVRDANAAHQRSLRRHGPLVATPLRVDQIRQHARRDRPSFVATILGVQHILRREEALPR